MVEPLADDALREEGVAALEERLDSVQALRFMALLSREPFDYQCWREGNFLGMSLAKVLQDAHAMSK